MKRILEVISNPFYILPAHWNDTDSLILSHEW